MKRFTAFIIFSGLQGYNQTNDSIKLRLTEFQWVTLLTDDSIYEFTRFILNHNNHIRYALSTVNLS